MPDSLPAPLSYTAPRPSLHPLIAQVYLAEWAATQVAVKVLIGGQLASSGEVQRVLALSAPIQQKLEQEASLLASLRCGGGVCWRVSGWERVGLTARNRPCWHCCCRGACHDTCPPTPVPNHTHRHPNVVNFMAICREPPCIVTEYCARGSLAEVRLAG